MGLYSAVQPGRGVLYSYNYAIIIIIITIPSYGNLV
jgi:hypothetical protein